MKKILGVLALLMCGCIVYACSEKGQITGGACSIKDLREKANKNNKLLKTQTTLFEYTKSFKGYRLKPLDIKKEPPEYLYYLEE